MPAVFIHGVPDTARLWSELLARLSRRDVVTLGLPGFQTSLPEHFDSSKESYVAWIIEQLERIGTAVDLVAHDWGAILMQRVVSIRPDLIRTWAGGGGIVDREYAWHDFARHLQTPEVGEQVLEATMGPEAGVPLLVQLGIPAATAQEVAAGIDDRMKQSMLRLYRSATNVGAEWHAEVDAITRPGLVIWGRDDPFVPVRFGERLASRVGGRFLAFDDCGHWWPIQRAVETAEALERFWSNGYR